MAIPIPAGLTQKQLRRFLQEQREVSKDIKFRKQKESIEKGTKLVKKEDGSFSGDPDKTNPEKKAALETARFALRGTRNVLKTAPNFGRKAIPKTRTVFKKGPRGVLVLKTGSFYGKGNIL